jgi:hypothetical protein
MRIEEQMTAEFDYLRKRLQVAMENVARKEILWQEMYFTLSVTKILECTVLRQCGHIERK